MGLPGEGVEHAPDGDAGEHAVIAPEAHVDGLEGCGHCQGCGTRCGVSGWIWVTAQRPLLGWGQFSGWPHSCCSPSHLPLPIEGASTNGIWSLETDSEKVTVVSKLLLRDVTQSCDCFLAEQRPRWGFPPHPFGWSSCIFSKKDFNRNDFCFTWLRKSM